MNLERDLTKYVVSVDDSVLAALQKIDSNKARVVFCVDSSGRLKGSFSDGDFRRWITSASPMPDLSTTVGSVANTSPTTVEKGADAATVTSKFQRGIDLIPVVDEQGHVTAIASRYASELKIGRHIVGAGHPAVMIAEIGNNHQGSVDFAKELVDLAADSNADVVKFQLRDLSALYRAGDTNSAGEDLGAQYTLQLLEKFSLPAEKLFEVFDHAKARGVDVMCTPWDLPSVDALAEYGAEALKIASADMTNHELLTYAGAKGLPLIVSTGMSTEHEILESTEVLRSTGAPFAMLHCQSSYPAPFKDINLRYMKRLGEITGAPVGYSGHERGFHVPLAAVAMGATIIEKHFTTDRELEGNDHKVSLLPNEFAEMVARTRELEEALGTDEARDVTTGELMNRTNLAKSLVATRRIEIGETLKAEDISVKSPGRGLQPNRLRDLIGRTANRVVDAGDFFYATDLQDKAVQGRQYSFRRPWGLPVRFHDYAKLIEHSTPDFLEFHFSFKDLDTDPKPFFTAGEKLPMTLTTHAPDLFAGDFLIDLASFDESIFERSIHEVQRVIDLTRDLTQWFEVPQAPVIVVTMGGFTRDAHLPASDRPRLYERIASGLKRLDMADVRVTAQTLPPFPWLMGGQQHHNLFLDPKDTAEFAKTYDTKLTLDVSHSKLAANFLHMSFADLVEQLAPYTEHLHLVDATGVDGEGVQVGDGEVDWKVLAEQLDRLAPNASFIPEIWQGHVNNGEGFWTALDRLEAWF